MGQFLSECTSQFFADDVVAVLSGQLGVRYTDQCIDLEKLFSIHLIIIRV